MQVAVYAYASNPNRLMFSAEYVTGSMEVSTSIWYQINGHGTAPEVSTQMLSSNPFGYFYADAPFDCRTYRFGEDLDFYVTSSYGGVTDSQSIDMANVGFKLAMRGFNDILMSVCDSTLQDIGFSSYVETD